MGSVKKWSAERVRRLLDFSCGGRFGAGAAMVEMQTEGVAALCEILRRQHVAYLADEVGLGKTMQALGVAACLASTLDAARVLVISPRKLVQIGWQMEAERFRSFVLRPGAPALTFKTHESLRHWLPGAGTDNTLQLLRHSSFMRPVFDAMQPNWDAVVDRLGLPPGARRYLLQQTPQKMESHEYNKAYAAGIKRWLKVSEIKFDLVIVDEAQCLRHFDNQTNTVLSTLLDGSVDKWLFLSATPAHSGVQDIATVLNRYPGRGKLIEQECLDDPARMRQRLANFMIRRPRTFLVGDKAVHKREYRRDDKDSLKLHCEDPLSLFSIAMVQRHLANTMGPHGGRFRNGYIASFESLEDSIRGRILTRPNAAAAPETADTDDQSERKSDFYFEHHHGADEQQAPDEEFVSETNRRFAEDFGFSLPHPKLDGVEKDLASQAFGDEEAGIVGGTKSVVFCRRVSSVHALRERLMQQYLTGIQVRCERVWGEVLDWDARLKDRGRHEPLDNDSTVQEDEPSAVHDGLNRVREAHAEGNWLYRFRATFVDGNRHALIFELNWFEYLSQEAGIDPKEAATRVPAELWAEAHAVATMSGDKRYRAREAQYLVWRCLDGHGAQIFGFDLAQLNFWREVLRNVLNLVRDLPAPLPPARSVQPQPEQLLLFSSLWSLAKGRDLQLALPDAPLGASREAKKEALYWRKITATVLGQYMRLSDAAIDLYFADHCATLQGGSMDDRFLDWLNSADIDGRRLRQVWLDWIEHHRLIFSSAIGERENIGPAEHAREKSFDFLFHLEPVVGITGSAGGHKRALQQFNTPGLPYVMVGTDSIREGVNLHLFCDRVMHYGMPWTPGDMEQRIGRVDRYFGRIERRLNAAALSGEKAELHVLYPYLCDTIEAQQIRTIMHRKRQSDATMQDDLGAPRGEGDQRSVELDVVLEPTELSEAVPSRPYFGVDRHLV